PYLPTDVTAFYPKGVPVLSFFTGSHEEYNRPVDDAETLDYEGMERIAHFALGIIADVAAGERPQYVEVPRSKERSGSRGSLRAYLGTIPDYAGGDIEGVKLSGVRADGPADKAGLQGGDIIVEFGGREIKNIYDYTYALDAVKIGQPVEVVVLRDGERVTLTVVPEARK
ncbi:MAG: PDZ domain-containing protein, partial [Candidatus Krumholzibacteria bacterium]|nr:PDZ domain-containing protein [Candidatus Krumholzibacteria bacterium]